MRNFRLQDDLVDNTSWDLIGRPDMHYDTTQPATGSQYVGTAFRPQDLVGVRLTDPFDDRVDYVAGEDGKPLSTPQWSLPADNNGVGVVSVYGGTTSFGGVTYGENPSHGASGIKSFRVTDDTAAQNIQWNPATGEWYDTLRETAGFPLVAVSDKQWANDTNDTIGDTANELYGTGLLVQQGERRVIERSLDIPHRASTHPISVEVERPWDVVMGSWPWTGEKASASQPVVSTPLFFADPIPDGIPSPTGAAGAMWPNTVDMAPQIMTWRTPPSPWDDGDGRNSYVDAGTIGHSR